MLKRLGSRGRRHRPGRDPHWDNIRYVSGTLVLFFHMAMMVENFAGLHWLYLATWPMRVPAFVMVAGFFSYAAPFSRREARRLVESIAVPYLLLGLLHTLQVGLTKDDWEFYTTDPAWAMWFLLSLLCWRLALPYLAQLRYPLASSLVLALAAGYVADFGPAGSLSRTFAFLPFFVLGWRLRGGLLARQLRSRRSLPVAAGIVAATLPIGWLLRDVVELRWLWLSHPYAQARVFDVTWGWTIRGAVLLYGMVVALSLIRLVPRRRLPLVTYLGAGGMYIYLLHPLVLRPLQAREAFTWVYSWPGLLAGLGVAALLAAALASPPVRWLTRPVIQPQLDWLFSAEPRGEAATGTGSRGPEADGDGAAAPAPPADPDLAGAGAGTGAGTGR